MSQHREPVTVSLPITVGQWVSSFVWVVLGILIAGFFIWLASFDEELNVVALVLGIIVLVLALASAVLEYRALPGVTLEFTAETLTIRPRRGAPVALALGDIKRLETLHIAPVKRRSKRGAGLTSPPSTSRPTFGGNEAAGWHLQVLLRSEESVGGTNGFPIGVDEDHVRELTAACRQFGVELKLAS